MVNNIYAYICKYSDYERKLAITSLIGFSDMILLAIITFNLEVLTDVLNSYFSNAIIKFIGGIFIFLFLLGIIMIFAGLFSFIRLLLDKQQFFSILVLMLFLAIEFLISGVQEFFGIKRNFKE